MCAVTRTYNFMGVALLYRIKWMCIFIPLRASIYTSSTIRDDVIHNALETGCELSISNPLSYFLLFVIQVSAQRFGMQ